MSDSFSPRRSIPVIAALLLVACTGAAHADPATDDSVGSRHEAADIEKFENDAAQADVSHDVEFYTKNLAEDWYAGASDGTFRTKQMRLAEVRDSSKTIVAKECISHLIVRLYGKTAVAQYIRSYTSHRDGECRERETIITDTFVNDDGRWVQIASHGSATHAGG